MLGYRALSVEHGLYMSDSIIGVLSRAGGPMEIAGSSRVMARVSDSARVMARVSDTPATASKEGVVIDCRSPQVFENHSRGLTSRASISSGYIETKWLRAATCLFPGISVASVQGIFSPRKCQWVAVKSVTRVLVQL